MFGSNNVGTWLSQFDYSYLVLALVAGAVLVVLFVTLALPAALCEVSAAARARRDYRRARGTQHLRMIRRSMKVLDSTITQLKQKESPLQAKIKDIDAVRSRELGLALCYCIAQNHLTDVHGIGLILRDRLMATCFDGTLESLRRADRVYGIGYQRAYSIRVWVTKWTQQLPQLGAQDFPGKEAISQKYTAELLRLQNELDDMARKYMALNQLRDEAATERDRLSRVKTRNLWRAYKGDKEASSVVDEYLQGTFPEWGQMPLWFKTLVGEYGG